MKIPSQKLRWRLSLFAAFLALIILLLFLLRRPEYGDEYNYTIKCIFNFCFYPFLILGMICNPAISSRLKSMLSSRAFWLTALAALAALCFISVPRFAPNYYELHWAHQYRLSACWIGAALCLAFTFAYLALRLNNNFSAILSLCAAICLSFGVAETYFLCTYQFKDGSFQDNAASKHVLAGQAQARPQSQMTSRGPWPVKPKHPSASYAQKEMYFDDVLFDVRYTFDDDNHRILPPHDPRCKADLLLFGCSFTFGWGLENERAWPWRLATLLGPQWKITDYAFNGFGAHQMYALLEDGAIEPPDAPFRQALFLAFGDHIHRHSGLFGINGPAYALKDGKIERQGLAFDKPYHKILDLPIWFNGSQTARELSIRLVGRLTQYHREEFINLYVALIVQSAKILQEKYKTKLSVLLWHDITEIAPRLREQGIPVLFADKILSRFQSEGEAFYHLVPHKDIHPNDLAAGEIAQALDKYYVDLYAQWQKQEHPAMDAREEEGNPAR